MGTIKHVLIMKVTVLGFVLATVAACVSFAATCNKILYPSVVISRLSLLINESRHLKNITVDRQPTKTTFLCQDADDDKEALVDNHDPQPPPGPPHSASPQESPISHHSPVPPPTAVNSSSSKEYSSPRNLHSPRDSKTSRPQPSPRAQASPQVISSLQAGQGYSPKSPENMTSRNTSAWRPMPRMSHAVAACPYVSEGNSGHSSVTIVAPLPTGILEEPIGSSENIVTIIEPKDPQQQQQLDIRDGKNYNESKADEREDVDNDGEEEVEEEEEEEGVEDDEAEVEDEEEEEDEDEEEEEEEDEEEEDRHNDERKVIRADDETEGEGDKNDSIDSEDQCIEVLTVVPGASGTTSDDRDEELDIDGGGGSLDWVSEEGGGPGLGPAGTVFHLRLVGSVDVAEESGKAPARKTTTCKRPKKDMVMEAVSRLKAPDGESQPSTEVDLFISTEKIMVLNTDLKEIMMDHALRTISYIADIGDLVVLMARRRVLPTDDTGNNIQKTPKMICHVFESDEAQFIAQSIGQAFQVAYLEFLKANGIEDHSFVKEMDYQEVLNSQEIFGDELQMFAKKELQKEVVVPKMKSEILGVVVVESGWGSMVPTVVIANLSPTGAAAKCGQLNIGDQIIAINGVSLVGLPLSTCQNYIKNTKYNTAVKLTVVPCPPVVEVKIRRPDTKYQLGFSVQNGVICSLLRGGIAERGGVRVGHRIIDINSQSVVAVPHEKIVNLLATSVGEIRMKTMPTSIFRLLTGQETPQYI
ncbi:protein lin-10 [Penaeus vannamei]|uniref:protein lin-10 n=1 Tax=Penaeus vannamei TaxID=6689 RepID=UPI00387F7D53